MTKNGMRPVHPGEILREEYLAQMGMSVHALSLALRVPATRLRMIVKERRSITPDTALRLARYFGTDAQSWLNLQLSYDLKIAEAELKGRIEREGPPKRINSSFFFTSRNERLLAATNHPTLAL